MNYSVVKNAAYILVNTPDMIVNNGTTQTMEAITNPDSEYLKNIGKHIRSFEEVVAYPPNQVYIGNITPDDLAKIEKPWVGKKVEGASKDGKKGEIMNQTQFIAMMQIVDAFEIVKFDEAYVETLKTEYGKNPLATEAEIAKIHGQPMVEVEKAIKEDGAEAIYDGGKIVGCVHRAHDYDVNLSAHVMFENLVVKASGVVALKNLVAKNNLDPASIDYVIECSEEACGDMNQRGGGNFAKSLAECAGLVSASGSDIRGFCAAPTHAMLVAASLVQAGTFKNVAVVAGGSSAKLGMNGKSHYEKELPVLEDVVGGFAILVSENDGKSPVIRTDLVGKHSVGTGSSPQAVMTSLVTNPLDKAGFKITDVDRYSVEMQNSDITKPAGAGDVPEANYKMIAALGVKRGELEKAAMKDFIAQHGMQGWAPTQGHIPSGVPYLGFAIDDLTTGDKNRAMLVGKGSLFLGRMTNLFDGVSFILERNTGKAAGGSTAGIGEDEIKKMIAESLREFATNLLGE